MRPIRMRPIRILITGFGPFPGAAINPSATLARTLARMRRFRRDDIIITHHIFDVRWKTIASDLDAQLARLQPDILLMFGVATRTPWLRVETRAHDMRTMLWPDQVGARPVRRKADAPHGVSRDTGSFPARLVSAARQSGMQTKLSHDAGRYLCNELFWQALNHPRAKSGAMLASFIHIPLPKSQRNSKYGGPAAPDQLSRAGMEILIRLMVEHRARRMRAHL